MKESGLLTATASGGAIAASHTASLGASKASASSASVGPPSSPSPASASAAAAAALLVAKAAHSLCIVEVKPAEMETCLSDTPQRRHSNPSYYRYGALTK